MAQIPTRVVAQGRVTIPKPERDALDLEKGDYVLIDVTPLEDEPERDETGPDTTETTADG